jgi:tripartite-type tricarboxylate transporter receptor subunit TctC
VIAGEVQFIFDSPYRLVSHQPSTDFERSQSRARIAGPQSEIPTFAELGYPKIVVDTSSGVFTTAGVSASIIDALSYAIFESVEGQANYFAFWYPPNATGGEQPH